MSSCEKCDGPHLPPPAWVGLTLVWAAAGHQSAAAALSHPHRPVSPSYKYFLSSLCWFQQLLNHILFINVCKKSRAAAALI